jgi:hypothetical protein
MRQLNPNLVTHKGALMIFSHAFFSSLTRVEFLRRVGESQDKTHGKYLIAYHKAIAKSNTRCENEDRNETGAVESSKNA